MSLSRRSFLLGAMAAPAIVRAESLMKLWVPPHTLVIVDESILAPAWLVEAMERAWTVAQPPVEWEWGASVLQLTGEPLRQAMRNAVLRERLEAGPGTHRPAAVCEQFTGGVRAVVHT